MAAIQGNGDGGLQAVGNPSHSSSLARDASIRAKLVTTLATVRQRESTSRLGNGDPPAEDPSSHQRSTCLVVHVKLPRVVDIKLPQVFVNIIIQLLQVLNIKLAQAPATSRSSHVKFQQRQVLDVKLRQVPAAKPRRVDCRKCRPQMSPENLSSRQSSLVAASDNISYEARLSCAQSVDGSSGNRVPSPYFYLI
ncbi:hypothetical protein DFH06DRAFT_1149504 [Mycena polygramma]|nr:hypothetical protein DFH06DRAFT_1149504 [Mycena polygramma]